MTINTEHLERERTNLECALSCEGGDPEYDNYDEREIGCVNCDGGWNHGCCDDLCRGSNEPEWCEYARPCRHCNPHGDVL